MSIHCNIIKANNKKLGLSYENIPCCCKTETTCVGVASSYIIPVMIQRSLRLSLKIVCDVAAVGRKSYSAADYPVHVHVVITILALYTASAEDHCGGDTDEKKPTPKKISYEQKKMLPHGYKKVSYYVICLEGLDYTAVVNYEHTHAKATKTDNSYKTRCRCEGTYVVYILCGVITSTERKI